jgi:3-isopropylmalate/(R)-2-methylmalate dehydratase small subunit
MPPFRTLTSRAAPLIRNNIDTDIIIPSREMKSVSKDGLADGLFANWRYSDVDARIPDPEFVLNRPEYAGTQIILGGENFGCGSSREHAVWALSEFGIRAVIAKSFSPIFRGNCIRNGVLPVAMNSEQIRDACGPVTIDLPARTIHAAGREFPFEIDDEAWQMLTEGLDPIALTLRMADRIAAHEHASRAARAWAWNSLPNAGCE